MAFRPQTEAELAELVARAEAPLVLRGGGTRGPDLAGDVLETGGLSGITLYEPGSLTLVAGAGTPLADIEAALAAENQRLAFEPWQAGPVLGREGGSTIGGVVAANASGPRRITVGAARDFLLGVRFVDGTGAVVKNGGRVMKNVTGYDLVKLMAGSWGTLGVLTEVSLKVLPRPETAACLLIDGLPVAKAVAVMSRALGAPYEVSGAAHVPVGLSGHPVTMLRIEGFERSVAYRLGQLRALFGDLPCREERDPQAVAMGWAWIRDAAPMHGTPGDLWRISVKPSDAPAVIEALAPDRCLLDWGGGLIWAELAPGTDIRPLPVPGHATLIRGGPAPMFQPQAPAVAALTAGIKARFDPKGLFNPGLVL